MLNASQRRFTFFISLPLIVLSTFATTTMLSAEQNPTVDVDFNRDIRPILAQHCYACHGPDAKQRKADLRLDDRAVAIKVGAIQPGDTGASELVQRINHEDPEERMPPASTERSLSVDEKQKLTQWIAQGATYSQHWAFVAPKRPQLPRQRKAKWSSNPIDAFVLARLQREGLKPSPEADRSTLLRRATFDLTGLPPSPAELVAFQADRSPQAYEKVVDRLFASPRFGERMAQHWLDLARYADSDGYHDDTKRAMWPYRDYVIRSFNRNKPFDQFTREQIAGDQIPNATLEQITGSAFHRNGPTSSEGGANPEEYRVKYAVDRVNTTASVWLGLTLQCTECHDHKYDPFTQKEFYQLFAFFDQVPGNTLHRGFFAPPSKPVPSLSQANKLAKLDHRITTITAQLDGSNAGLESEQKKLIQERASLQKQRKVIEKAFPRLRIMQDAPKRIPTYILVRGDFRRRGGQVQPGVPAILPPFPTATSPRLALASWLVDPKNPLPARVTVNRFWAMIFGAGIVRTPNDFGSRGDWPTHQELLDWLAVEFIESGWDVKHLLKLIVTSSTYRQSSAVGPDLLKRDPTNRLLARGPRFRLPAEMVRDNALFVSGMLHEEIGGRSIKPYQPAGLWREMSYGQGKKYVQDHGPSLYRRGVYMFWKRSILNPSYSIFDAPTREDCEVQRSRTNTALHALVLLNDVTFVEAARVFAERIITQGGRLTDERVDYAYGRALSRRPSKKEHALLADIFKDMLEHYRKHPDAAKQVVTAGEWPATKGVDPVEHAAWTSVAQVILNLDETITKE